STRVPFLFPPLPPSLPHFSLFPSVSLSLSFSPSFSSIPSLLPLSSLSSTQLYNLSAEPERKEFLDKLFDYMQKKGSPITRVPIMAKQPLDLYRLFKLVVERGGLVEVIKKKAWRAVAKELNLPASITSAAFTMRSQYVKYLYPFECEMENLSDPQELQVAIDSHKRDRRQSDAAEFMHQPLGAGRTTLESLTPVTNTITHTPQGIQILSSPTMALPHGAIPPYSGSFIVTGPGGTQMVTPQMSGPPQLVQMTATHHGIPIMVPALAPGKPADLGAMQQQQQQGEDRDDVSSQASSEASDRENSAPPTKRVALDIGGRIVAATRIHPGATAGFMMTPTRHMVPTSHFASPHVIQMGPNSHIPVVMPTSTATGFMSQTSSPVDTGVSNGLVFKDDSSSRRSPLENGACSPHLLVSGAGSAKPTQVVSASHLLHMTSPRHPTVPLVLPTNAITLGHHHGNSSKHRSSQSSSSSNPSVNHTHPSSTATDKSHHSKHNGGALSTAGSTSLKMPFANIAIQSGTLGTYPYVTPFNPHNLIL
ncbi:AT-rich interactive domain-containing protein 3A, partial [Geodia barretti]